MVIGLCSGVMRARILLGVLIVAALVTAIVILWPGPAATDSTTTTAVAAPSTTTAEETTTTVPGPTTVAGSHVVETVEEAEAILRELWFGWFEGIYNQDEERIKEVVGTQEFLDVARDRFGVMEFTAEPTPEGLVISDVEILRSDEDCLSVWWRGDGTSFRGPGAFTEDVVVMRWIERWVLTARWAYRNDLWEADCEALLEPLS